MVQMAYNIARVTYRRLPTRANTWHKEFSDTLYFAKNFLFLASITSFTVDTLNSLIHYSMRFACEFVYYSQHLADRVCRLCWKSTRSASTYFEGRSKQVLFIYLLVITLPFYFSFSCVQHTVHSHFYADPPSGGGVNPLAQVDTPLMWKSIKLLPPDVIF